MRVPDESAPERRAAAAVEFERVNTTPAPPPMANAYVEAGVMGYVFGEVWRRGVLSVRDRRLVALSCAAVSAAAVPIEAHVWGALNSGDLTYDAFDELVLHVATQIGWPRAAVLNSQGAAVRRRMEESGHVSTASTGPTPRVEPSSPEHRRARGLAAHQDILGRDPDRVTSPFATEATIDFLYGEIWRRTDHLSVRDRRLVTISCAAALGADEEAADHVSAALTSGDCSAEELREVVVHVAVYAGWPLARRLDALVERAVETAGAS